MKMIKERLLLQDINKTKNIIQYINEAVSNKKT